MKLRYQLLAILLLTALVGCGGKGEAKPASPMEFTFYGTDKSHTYRSTHFAKDLEAAGYNVGPTEMAVLLVPQVGTPEHDRQRKALLNAGPEERAFAVITADQSGTYTLGYHTSPDITATLYQERSQGFHILLLDSSGYLLLESDEVLPSEVIQQYFPID